MATVLASVVDIVIELATKVDDVMHRHKNNAVLVIDNSYVVRDINLNRVTNVLFNVYTNHP